MKDYQTEVEVLTSSCSRYKKGDKVCFQGAFIDKANSDAICMVAMNAIYPFIYAARRGGSVKPTPVQCPDCEESVSFRIKRIE